MVAFLLVFYFKAAYKGNNNLHLFSDLFFIYFVNFCLLYNTWSEKGAFCEHFLEITAKFIDEKSEFNHTRYKWQQFYTVSKKYNVIFLFLNKEKFYYPRKFFYLQRKDFSSKAEFDACFEICLIYFERSRWNRPVNYNNWIMTGKLVMIISKARGYYWLWGWINIHE